jgi:hypothetical protein
MKTALVTIVTVALSFACSREPATNNSNAATATPVAIPSQTAGPPPSPSPSPADEAASEAPEDFEGTAGNTEKKNLNATGAVLLREVRSAKHANFDRVVFEFEGARLPSYKLEYIDKPVRECGSGDVVPFAGDAWLQVRFTGANAHTEAGEPTVKDRTRSPNLPIVKDLKLTCDFEAEVEWVMGVASPNKYRVLELKRPTRLVIDVKHKR